MLQRSLDKGTAAERFSRMVAELGGSKDLLEKPAKHLAAAPHRMEVYIAKPGVVTTIDTRAIGLAVIQLGGGRRVASDVIDHRVGFTGLAGKGARVDAKQPVATVWAKDRGTAEAAVAALIAAYTVGKAGQEASKPVRARIKDAAS